MLHEDALSEFYLMSKYGQIFRMKLIEHLKPAQGLSSSSRTSKKYITKDVSKGGCLIMDKIMAEDPYTGIDFTAWTTQNQIRLGVTQIERRKNRAVIKHKKVYGFFEHSNIEYYHCFLSNTVFWSCVLLAGLLNIVSQVLWNEYYEELSKDLFKEENTGIYYLIVYLDHLVLLTFLVEVIMWSLYDGKKYILSYTCWVTILAIFSIGYMTSILLYNGLILDNSSSRRNPFTLENQKARILICQSCRLVLCSRIMLMFKQSRIILTSVIQALPGLTYIGIMMTLTTLLYWLIGMNFFVEYERRHGQYVVSRYTQYGLSEAEALLLYLFRLFTLSNSINDLRATTELHGGWSAIYVISWMVVSNYIFANLLTAVLINNFSNVKQKLVGENQRIEDINNKILQLKRLNDNINEDRMRLRRSNRLDLMQPHVEFTRDSDDLDIDIQADDFDSASNVINVFDGVMADHEIPFEVRRTMMVHNPPTFDIKTYLMTWPPTSFSAQLEMEPVKPPKSRTSEHSALAKRSKSLGKGLRKSKSQPRNTNSNAKNTKPKTTDGAVENGKEGEVERTRLTLPQVIVSPSVESLGASGRLGSIHGTQSNWSHDYRSNKGPMKRVTYSTTSSIGWHQKEKSNSVIDSWKKSLYSDFGFDFLNMDAETSHATLNSINLAKLSGENLTVDIEKLYAMISAVKSIQDSEFATVWAKDTLYQFFRAMEQLFENIREREKLLKLCNKALLHILDDKFEVKLML